VTSSSTLIVRAQLLAFNQHLTVPSGSLSSLQDGGYGSPGYISPSGPGSSSLGSRWATKQPLFVACHGRFHASMDLSRRRTGMTMWGNHHINVMAVAVIR